MKLKDGYWTKGSVWEFDWYIDLFFAEAMAYGKNPVKLGYMQPILGDEFLDFKYKDQILKDFDKFFDNQNRVQSLLRSQQKILEGADSLINQLEINKFDSLTYERIQKDLSLLMASVSVVFDQLIEEEVSIVANEEDIDLTRLVGYIVDKSSHTKLHQNNSDLLNIFSTSKLEITRSDFKYNKLPNDIKRKIVVHKQKYGWLNTGERSNKPWSEQDFLVQMKVLVSKEREEVVKLQTKKFSEKSQKLLETIIKININDNVAADKQVYLDFLFQKFLSQKLGGDYIEEIIENLSFAEILSIIKNPKQIDRFKDRKDNYLRVAWQQDGKIHTHYFKHPNEFKKIQLLVQRLATSKIIKGTVASQGIVKGTARIIKSQKDLQLFRKGEILVAEKTQPRYTPYMVRASAIVTDVGGITSHAAIVSREFQIPCIVGTGNATKMLKSGDFIIVDAQEGVVNKLS